LAAAEHPLWLPVAFKISKGLSLGETFTIIKGGREYPFTIAGFYESGLESSDGYGYKLILTDADYDLFSMIFESGGDLSYNTIAFCFDADESFDFLSYVEKCGRDSSVNLLSSTTYLSQQDEEINEKAFADMFLGLTAGLSLITMLSALFMIRHKISNDIEDQMQQIGVLEALGYRAREISLAYLYEYVISGGAGCLLGVLAAFLITPAINRFGESVLGRTISGAADIWKVFAVALVIFVFVILFALLKARTVKKYPPVMALRRGIATHHFGKNILPLAHMKGNINVRLAMKSMLADLRSCVGVFICIVAAGMTILFSILSFMFFKDGADEISKMMGIDTEVAMVTLMGGVDPEKTCEEITAMPEVRKALVTFETNGIDVKDSDLSGTVQVFDDYSKTETFQPAFGRYPEQDNEVMISYRRSVNENLSLGDQIVLQNDGLEKSYVITGLVSAMLNSGSAIYLTPEGYRRINDNARPSQINVYLEDGVGYDEFEEKLEELYGVSAKNAMTGADAGESLEERVRAAANEKIAVLLTQYGVTSVDYAVEVNGQLITGNSRPFVIKEVSNWQGIIKTQIEPIAQTFKTFTLLAAILITGIVAVILSIITASNVRRQRHSLGIMKGLGYSSKDLMTQMAVRIMPVILLSLIVASVGAVWVNKIFWLALLGLIAKTDPAVILVTDLVLAVFCYFVTYLGAGRIRKISVNELMTE
ncbi:MAG: FtsX-like permease family protein, partial [Lachnospiraceae bacterium]|nr:FtsX-like permease family protein [Lachnospiraceae bacterium]